MFIHNLRDMVVDVFDDIFRMREHKVSCAKFLTMAYIL